jgi:hypothetical protein
MSIGNLKDSGNQGNNFPWQLKMLQGLQGIIDELQGSLDVTIINPLGQQVMADSVSVVIASDQAGVARTPGIIRATGAGTIAPLVYDFSVSNVGAANGTILGQTIKPGETLNFGAGAVNNYYAASTITYNGTGTELVIIYNA